MKKIIFAFLMVAVIILVKGCAGNEGMEQKQDKPTVKPTESQATVTPKVTDMVTPTAVPTNIATVEPTQSAQKNKELPIEEDMITFTGTVVSVYPILTIKTSDLNEGVTENITIDVDSFSTEAERANSSIELENSTFPISELAVDDIVQVCSEYSLENGKRIIGLDYYSNMEMIKSMDEYDFSKEHLISDLIDEYTDQQTIQSIHLSYQPEYYKASFEASITDIKRIQKFFEIMGNYSCFTKDQILSKNMDTYDISCKICYGENQTFYVAWNDKEFYLADSLTSDAITRYTYYHNARPEPIEVASAFFTEEGVIKIAKECVQYEEIYGTGTYDMRRGYSVDLNMDGTKENIFIGYYGSDIWYNRYSDDMTLNEAMDAHLVLYINGNKFCELNHDEANISHFNIMDLDTQDGKLELVIFNYGSSCDYFYSFYHFDGNEVHSIGTVPTYEFSSNPDPEKPNKTLMTGSMRLDILQTWFADASWEISDNGTIDLIQQPLYYPNDGRNFTLLYQLNAYKDKSTSSERITLKPGDLTALSTDNETWVQVETKDEQVVWIYLEHGWLIPAEDITEPDFDYSKYEKDYLPLFEGLIFAD